MRKVHFAYFLIIFLMLGCGKSSKKVFYVNSYHSGYPSSDQVEQAILQTLNGVYSIEVFHLNAKKLSATQIKERAKVAWQQISLFSPDILIVSDDNAVESILVPHISEMDYPVLFCGVNWSAEKYNLPKDKVTGMLEVLPVSQCLDAINHAGYNFQTITVLSENSSAEGKNKETLVPRFKKMGLEVNYIMAKDFEEWQTAFNQSQTEGNVVFMPTNGGIKNWDDSKAEEHVNQNLTVPVFSCDDFMVKYGVFGLTKVAAEQGEYVAKMAMEILEGNKAIVDIPIVENNQTECFINTPLANKIHFELNTNINCKTIRHDNP